MKNKSNTTIVDGNHNIVIQDVKADSIILNVNGDVQEIRNDLADLKTVLEQFQLKTFQQGNSTYEIAQMDEANFGFLTGKRAFNEWLTKYLIQAIEPHSKSAAKFIEKVNSIPDWESQKRISNKAKEIIAYSYVGIIGIQLRKQIAIGEEEFSEKKQRNYIENSIITVKRTLELLIFALLSRLWDYQQQNYKALTKEQNELIEHFFDDSFERDITGLVKLLKTLTEIYGQNQLEFPIPELENRKGLLNLDSDFIKACDKMQIINGILDAETYTSLDCFEAEKQLTSLLSGLNFLSAYRMVSIKAINYEAMRNSQARYLHNYTALGINVKSEINPDRINYTDQPINTDAVLLFKGQYNHSINLFPFVIDLNALTFEGGVKICFYSSRNLEDDSLDYRFLENNDIENIVFNNIRKAILEADEQEKAKLMNKLMKDRKDRIELKLDTVFEMFQQARKTIVGANALDFSDIDDEEDDF